jgi:hypothetical protein
MAYQPSHIPNIEKRFNRIIRAVDRNLSAGVTRFTDHTQTSFQERIRAQEFDSFAEVPLAESTVAKKMRYDLDPRTMIATEHYVEEIKIFKRAVKRGYLYFVGHSPQAMSKDENRELTYTPLRLVAKVQEYGSESRNIPARPHWAPHLSTLKKELPAEARKIRRAILKDMRGIK